MNPAFKGVGEAAGAGIGEFIALRYLQAISLSDPTDAVYYFIGRYGLLFVALAVGLTLLMQGLTSKAPAPKGEGMVKVKIVADIKGLLETAKAGPFEVSQSDFFAFLDVCKLKLREYGKWAQVKYIDPPKQEVSR